MEVCEKNNCDSSASKQSCDASVKHMNRGSISELLQCDSKICFSLNPFAVIFAFSWTWMTLSFSVFELNWCECWKLAVGLCVELPDGECASRQMSEVTDSCFLAELRWRRGHGAAWNTHGHARCIHKKSRKYPGDCNCFMRLSHFTMDLHWIWNTHDAPSGQSILVNAEWFFSLMLDDSNYHFLFNSWLIILK